MNWCRGSVSVLTYDTGSADHFSQDKGSNDAVRPYQVDNICNIDEASGEYHLHNTHHTTTTPTPTQHDPDVHTANVIQDLTTDGAFVYPGINDTDGVYTSLGIGGVGVGGISGVGTVVPDGDKHELSVGDGVDDGVRRVAVLSDGEADGVWVVVEAGGDDDDDGDGGDGDDGDNERESGHDDDDDGRVNNGQMLDVRVGVGDGSDGGDGDDDSVDGGEQVLFDVEGEQSPSKENHEEQMMQTSEATTTTTTATTATTPAPGPGNNKDDPWEHLLRKQENIVENFSPDLVEYKLQQLQHNRIATPSIHPCDHLPADYNQWLRKATSLKVLVGGGGVAGLAALGTLLQLGEEDVLLLEATDRLGGRLTTVRHGSWVVDEGPSVIQGGENNPLYQIAREEGRLGDPIEDIVPSNRVVYSSGQRVSLTVAEQHAGVEQLAKMDMTHKLNHYYGRPLGDLYNDIYNTMWGDIGDEMDQDASKYILHQTVSNEFGADSWRNFSARDADNFQPLGQHHGWKGGMDGFIKYLLAKIPPRKIRMASPICKVFWDVGGGRQVLVVTADGSSYLAQHLVVTLPLGVLQERHSYTFVPALSTTIYTALMGVQPGAVNKLALGWAVPWWGSQPFNMLIFWKTFAFPPEMEWVSSIVQVKSVSNYPAQMEVTVTGAASRMMETLDPETVITHLMAFLRSVNSAFVIPLPLFFHRSKWTSNMWARGSYHSYVTMGGYSYGLHDRGAFIPKLVNSKGIQTVMFGGEHTSTDRYGTVDGAFLSGVRAAHWVITQLDQKWKHAGGQNLFCRQNIPLNYYDLYKDPSSFYQKANKFCEPKYDSEEVLVKSQKKNKRKNNQRVNVQGKENETKSPTLDNQTPDIPVFTHHLPVLGIGLVTETPTSPHSYRIPLRPSDLAGKETVDTQFTNIESRIHTGNFYLPDVMDGVKATGNGNLFIQDTVGTVKRTDTITYADDVVDDLIKLVGQQYDETKERGNNKRKNNKPKQNRNRNSSNNSQNRRKDSKWKNRIRENQRPFLSETVISPPVHDETTSVLDISDGQTHVHYHFKDLRNRKKTPPEVAIDTTTMNVKDNVPLYTNGILGNDQGHLSQRLSGTQHDRIKSVDETPDTEGSLHQPDVNPNLLSIIKIITALTKRGHNSSEMHPTRKGNHSSDVTLVNTSTSSSSSSPSVSQVVPEILLPSLQGNPELGSTSPDPLTAYIMNMQHQGSDPHKFSSNKRIIKGSRRNKRNKKRKKNRDAERPKLQLKNKPDQLTEQLKDIARDYVKEMQQNPNAMDSTHSNVNLSNDEGDLKVIQPKRPPVIFPQVGISHSIPSLHTKATGNTFSSLLIPPRDVLTR
ncbi:hypothetical protein Pmani_019003 [Petrolisthes manimaculis]|uniref:Amine oxidase domain-containing protein n=1 Tax=Petrolisthes manimaculis TaxID=1843537 RepID=A0AAE1PLC0_9EUCA|nr:hypothetical protein Pmani_019003 [Petrolisthes manimaculis]